MYQPETTGTTNRDQLVARNALRLKLWADDTFAHRFLCHPERECEDGCHGPMAPGYAGRVALYQSDLED